MPREVVFDPKYEPLFRPPTHDDPRYTVITGGRGSGKSYAVSSANLVDTFRNDRNILYSRYTLVAADISIIPEYLDKMQLLGKERYFRTTKDTITNVQSGGTMYFRGILASSGNQTARLKSIAKLRKFVLDEAQELTRESDFDTIDLSIRELDVPNGVQLILNPSDIHHWIYRRFFGSRGVPYDFNGRVDDTLYIHTDWRDNRANLHPSFIARALEMERTDPEKYANIYLGDWSVKRTGLIYPRWQPCTLQDIPTGLEWWYGNDWGYGGDPDALVRVAFDPLTRALYCVEVLYSTGKLPRDVAAAIRQDCQRMGLDAGEVLVYCDPARPDSIAELRTQYGINALPGINRDKPGRIGYLQGFNVRYVGDHIRQEVETYSWKPNKWDEDTFSDVPQDGGDHCFVGSTLITTINGSKRIDQIQENDLVLTSQGYKRVLKKFNNGRKKIREYTIVFRNFVAQIEATEDHKIKTKKGWKQLKDLCETDVLYLCSSSTAKFTGSTQASATSVDTTSGCTASSGNTTTAQSRKGTTSTTRMATRTTTKLITSNLLPAPNISASTPTSALLPTPKFSRIISTRLWRQLKSGIAHLKAASGIASTPRLRPQESAWSTPAPIAARRLWPKKSQQSTTSALTSAVRHTGANPASTMRPGYASGAVSPSPSINTMVPAFAPSLVEQPITALYCGSARIEQVYDLLVEDMHEYFANGVLVHNCMDSISYSTTHLRRLGISNDLGDLPK